MPKYLRGKQLQISADRSFHKRLKQPWRKAQEESFAAEHAGDTDMELYEYVKARRRKLGRKMNRDNTIGYVYITKRLGNWQFLLSVIGLELRDEQEAEAPPSAPKRAPRVWTIS